MRGPLKLRKEKNSLRYDSSLNLLYVSDFKNRLAKSCEAPGKPFKARYYGPYTVAKKLTDVNYTVNTPGRRKQKQLCHINMLKKYIDRDSTIISSVNRVICVPLEQKLNGL